MRILLDARYLDGTFSGIGTYSASLIEHLSRVDQTNEYSVLVRPGFGGNLAVGPNFQFLSCRAAPISVYTMAALGRSVDALGVDLMHSFAPVAPLRMRTPLAITMHDLQPLLDPNFSGHRPWPLPWAYNAFYRTLYPAMLRRAKWVITVSYYTRDCLAELFPAEVPKLFVAQSGLDPELLKPLPVSGAEARQRHGLPGPYILYYGSTRPNKNIPNAIRGFARYLQENDDAETQLVLILKTDRFFRDVRRTLRAEGLQDRVTILDQVPFNDRRALLSEARLLLFPTKFEGFGFPPLEAMAAGTPVVAGNDGALPEVCGDAAHFVDPDDIDSIAEGIATVLQDPNLRRILVEKGHLQVQQFDWTDCAERVRDVYQLLF